MTDFEQLLNDVVQGKSNLAPLRSWLDKQLSQPGCNHAALMAALDKAQDAGLSEPVARAIRTHIESVPRTAAPVETFPFELDAPPPSKTGTPSGDKTVEVKKVKASPAKPSAEKTQMMNPATAEKTQISAQNATTRPATDRTTTAGGDRTMVQTPAAGNSAVELTTDHGRTVITHSSAGEDPTSRHGQKGDVETDPFAIDSSTPTAGRSGTPTGTSWRTSTGLKASGGPDNVGPGSVLKERFELMDVLGEGGMGKVYKARDLLKVEAKDKNPYIAVKTLTGDFKQHPESFIALQRESSKAQRLAHPNIATVYDFDRDGGMVYMTMELMEGDELAKYIKHLPAGGLPVADAMRIIKQLCDGLAYAHSKQLVHSDFKPGNAFLTKDGTVKLLDFGIARASKTRKDTQGETTVFDPGQLGALTPAYATVEMFEGLDPDGRDDIYALACVSYELLTGKHPFNKLSAPKVLEKGLKPAPIAKLTSRQNKALMRALALRRDDRTPTVEDFWEDLKPRKDRRLQFAGIGVASVLALALALYSPIKTAINAKRDRQIAEQIENGPPGDIPTIIASLDNIGSDSRRQILDTSRQKIIKYYEDQADADVAESKGLYNYAAAVDLINTANKLYPDSADLSQYTTTLNNNKASTINRLTTEFNSMMSTNKLMPSKDNNDVTDVVKKLRMVDPSSSMLKDFRLTTSYVNLVKQTVGARDYVQANDQLKVALDYSPKDPSLLNLQDTVKRELKRQQDAQLVAQLEGKIKEATPGLHALADFDKTRGDMLRLHDLNPSDPILVKLNDPLKTALSTALTSAANQKRWEDAEKALLAYSHLLAPAELLNQRQALNQAEVTGAYVPTDMQARLNQTKQHRDAIQTLLGEAKYDSDWDAQLLVQFQETTAGLQPNDMDWYQEMRDNVAKTYIKLSQQMLSQNLFNASSNLLATGRQYSPSLADFGPAEQAITTAQQAFDAAQKDKQRVAQIDALKNQILTQLNASLLDQAAQTEATLKQQQLPAGDTFFSDALPKAKAGAYLNLAKNSAAAGRYRDALNLVNKGLLISPLEELKKAQADYSAQQSKGDLYALVDNLQTSNVNDLKAKFAEVNRQFPREQSEIASNLNKRLVAHIEGLKDSDPGTAYDLWNALKSAFPDNATIQNMRVSPPARPSKFAALGRDAMKQNLLTKAQGYLDQGQQQETGNADLAGFADSLQKAQAAATQYFAGYQQYLQAGQAQTAQGYLNQALTMWTDNAAWQAEYKRKFATIQQPAHSANGGKPCTADIAGYGSQGRGTCYDVVDSNVRGPTMVVVPAGNNITQPFAIGKYEVSVGDLNAYCRSTGQCSPLGEDDKMPATGIPFSEAKGYVAWLSQKSGAHYFIPSQEQWQYAASMGGTDTSRDFNCHVTQGDTVIKGLSMVTVETGRANTWGLVNYVGNAQEFVSDGSNIQAMGGDYQDSLVDCTTSLSRPTSGAADPLTGFRVARDIGQ